MLISYKIILLLVVQAVHLKVVALQIFGFVANVEKQILLEQHFVKNVVTKINRTSNFFAWA